MIEVFYLEFRIQFVIEFIQLHEMKFISRIGARVVQK